MMNSDEQWRIPTLPFQLPAVISELRSLARGGLEQQNEGEGEEVKGLKFISGKLARLFDRNKKLKYSHISRILIDNFSSQSNDSRNIKRRVYDAINVMVAAGLFEKIGDSLERRQQDGYRERVQQLKNHLGTQLAQIQAKIQKRRQVLGQFIKRKKKIQEMIEMNKKRKQSQRIVNPILINVGNSIDNTKLMIQNQTLCAIDVRRDKKKGYKGGSQEQTTILKDLQFAQYL